MNKNPLNDQIVLMKTKKIPHFKSLHFLILLKEEP
jgi:hypothetical protein